MFDALVHTDEGEAEARALGVTGRLRAGANARGPLTATGLHPAEVDADWPARVKSLEAALDEHAALGECGLDGRAGMPDLALQELAFEAQLKCAKAPPWAELGNTPMPVVVHLVRATERGLLCLERFAPLRGFVHGFSGPKEIVPRILETGLHISFGGLLLNPSARRAREAAAEVPLERLLVETDAPALAAPRLVEVISELARLRGGSPESVAAATAANARALLMPDRDSAAISNGS